MALTAKQRMVRGYAYAIYIDGTRTLSSIGASYTEDVKAYAAANFTMEQLDAALAAGRITEAEYRDTLALVGTEQTGVWVGV